MRQPLKIVRFDPVGRNSVSESAQFVSSWSLVTNNTQPRLRGTAVFDRVGLFSRITSFVIFHAWKKCKVGRALNGNPKNTLPNE
jgi:hypothetical protein